MNTEQVQEPWVMFIGTDEGIRIQVVYAFDFGDCDRIFEEYIYPSIVELTPNLLWTERGEQARDEISTSLCHIKEFWG